MAKQKRDLYAEIQERIIALMEEHGTDWLKPFGGQSAGMPLRNNGIPYRGLNVPLLWSAGYSGAHWGTYNQWQAKGAQVRLGEKGTTIFFNKPIERKNKTTGEVDKFWMLRMHTVFNSEQVEGYEEPANAARTSEVELIAMADKFAAETGADIRVQGNDRAFYAPELDYIQIPKPDAFRATDTSTATESYYSTMFHELAHWTGSQERLKRDHTGTFGSESYAVEELIAEMSAAFTCGLLGVSNEPRADHAKYLNGWKKAIKNDPRAFTRAAAAAQRATDYLFARGDNKDIVLGDPTE